MQSSKVLISHMVYAIIESTPCCLPEDTYYAIADDYPTAVADADLLADALEQAGWECDRSWASGDNYYNIRCVKPGTLSGQPRMIEVIQDPQRKCSDPVY